VHRSLCRPIAYLLVELKRTKTVYEYSKKNTPGNPVIKVERVQGEWEMADRDMEMRVGSRTGRGLVGGKKGR
jgi:hypothetical protein